MSNASRKKTIHAYPDGEGENIYLELNKRIWRSMGYAVSPFPGILGLLKLVATRQDIAILNWFEDRLSGKKNQLFSFLTSVIVLFLMRIIFRQIIWVRHNLKPHDQHSAPLYHLLIRLLTYFSDSIVTHRPVSSINSTYIPHPLYPFNSEYLSNMRDIPFLYFGAIKPYKGLEDLIAVWPKSLPLMMVGFCKNMQLEQLIKDRIVENDLDITWTNVFLDYDNLCQLISRTQYVVLPHTDDAMIVSGSFYHAASLGANVLVRDGQFYRDYLKRFPFVTSFQMSLLPSTLQTLEPYQPDDIITEANSELSDSVIASNWEKIFYGR